MEMKAKWLVLVFPFLLVSCGTTTNPSVSSSGNSSTPTSEASESSVADEETTSSSEEISSSEEELSAVSSTEIPEGYIGLYLHSNFDTDIVYQVITIEKNTKTKKPAFPTHTGYRAFDWYTDAAGTTAFNFNKVITDSVDLYPKWYQDNVFEAEYTDLEEKQGFGYSGGSGGIQMIGKDTYNAGASNGYYVSYLYYNGAFLEWDITADKATSDCVISLSLTSEFYSYSFDDTSLGVSVNDTNLSGYSINLSGAYDVSANNLRPFTTHTIAKDVSLKEGENVIKMTVTNNTGHGGTLYAEAPVVDCLYVSVNGASLSWSPYTENVTEWEELHQE